MTREQLDLIPPRFLKRGAYGGCTQLIAWLRARGLTMTLLELETERDRRGVSR